MRTAAPLLLLGSLLLSACLPVPSAATRTPGPPAATGTPSLTPSLTPTAQPTLGIDPAALRGTHLQVWTAFSGPAGEMFAQQVAQFNADNKWGLTVTASHYADYPALYDSLTAALASGESPDLAAALPEQTLAWEAAGAVVDLNPYVGDPLWGLAPAALADIPAVFQAQDEVGGRRLGLPAQRSTRLLFYNRTWARQLGFEAPPATADEFRQQACAANASFSTDASPQNDGFGGWIVDTDWQTSYSWLLAFGGGVLDDPDYRFRTDQNLAALQFIKSLFDEHCAWLSTNDQPYDDFANRHALFISGDLAELPQVQAALGRAGSRDEWTVLPFPGTSGTALVAYGPSYFILKSTPERQLAAWLLVRWLLSPESQAQWVEATGLFPLRSTLLDMIGPYRAASPQWEAAVALLPEARNVPARASWRKVRYVLEDGTTVIFRMGTPVGLIPGILAEMDNLAEELNR
jgi:multiple sugar transport system substrate-binding protein